MVVKKKRKSKIDYSYIASVSILGLMVALIIFFISNNHFSNVHACTGGTYINGTTTRLSNGNTISLCTDGETIWINKFPKK